MKDLLFGGISPQHFLVMLFFALLGVMISLLVHSTNRDPKAIRTPFRFKLLFLIDDNIQRILLNLLLIVVAIRFSKEILGFEIKPFIALLIGVSFDKLAELLRNTNLLDKK
jgi:hypothetical protein